MSSRTAFILFLLVLALVVRLPGVSANLPYFYDEDEAHHFNRSVRMLQSGDLHPHYFHKPSLPFYLRLPGMVVGYFYEVQQGRARSPKDIVTTDPYGIAQYSFSTSHPGMVKWARLATVAASLAIVLLVFLLAETFSGFAVATLAAMLTAITPGLLEQAAVVGVDTFAGFFSLGAVYLALRSYQDLCWKRALGAAALAGCAISCKYNAAPIVLPVIIAWTYLARSIEGKIPAAVGALVLSGLFFLLGSPTIVSSIPLFLEQAGYEVWHYAIAGHEGNAAEPGLSQAYFLLSHLMNTGIGYIPTIFAIGALALLAVSARNTGTLILVSFPVMYFVYMAQQRTNFPRNLVPLYPFIAILGTYTLVRIHHFLPRRLGGTMAGALTLLFVVQAGISAADYHAAKVTTQESRLEAATWLQANVSATNKLALDGTLQFEPWIRSLAGITLIDCGSIETKRLLAEGFTRVACAGWHKQPGLAEIIRFEGVEDKTRVIRSPQIIVYALAQKANS